MPLDIGRFRFRSPVCRMTTIHLDPIEELGAAVYNEFKKVVFNDIELYVQNIKKELKKIEKEMR